MRYHLKLTRMTVIKKARGNKCWWGCGEKGTLVHCWWEHELVSSLWKMVWRLVKKLKIDPPYDPAVLYIYTKETKQGTEELSIPSIHHVIIDSSQDNGTTEVSISGWMAEGNGGGIWMDVNTNGYYSSIKKEILPLQQHGWILKTLC